VPLLVVLAAAWPAGADVSPGETIAPENAASVKELLPPGVYTKVQRGMTMKIVASQRIDWPPPYKDATEKYSAQVMLSPDHRSMVGYVAGQPFPLIDPNDPDIAVKIMWNNAFRPISSDDYDLRYFDCYSLYGGAGGESPQIGYFQVGHYAGYNLVGRTEVEPMPIDPDFKINGRYWLFGVYPILAPDKYRGVGFIRYRYADPRRGDDSWVYVAQSRRVRRLSEGVLSISAGEQTFDPDHYSGFNAKTEEYSYKFLGEKQMLASVHAEHSPEIGCNHDGGVSACPEAWEKRRVYIVEATPRREMISQALHSKTMVYLDSEMWNEPYIETYDQKGELWQVRVYWLTYRDRPVPDAKVAIYPFKRLFIVAGVSTDVQTGLSTMCYLPGHEVPERECWYINMGAVDRQFFSVEALVKAARR
jgi:hypothetical protein